MDSKERIAALLREREGYERFGDTARIKAVDAELAQLGHKASAPAKRAEKRPAHKKSESR